MGKSVVLLRHPSNRFFSRFRNAHFYETAEEFSKLLLRTLANAPVPLSEQERAELGWMNATMRLYSAVQLDAAPRRHVKLAAILAGLHRKVCDLFFVSPAHVAVLRRYQKLAADEQRAANACATAKQA